MDLELEEQDISRPVLNVNKKVAKPSPTNTLESSIKDLIKIVASLNIPKTDFIIKETDIGAHSIYVNSINNTRLLVTSFFSRKFSIILTRRSISSLNL